MHDQSIVRVPLRAKDGSVRAYALIDTADAALVSPYRWAFSGGYAYRTEKVQGKKRTVWLHRAILGLAPGNAIEVDHKNRDGLDNRRSNLRSVNHGMNMQNASARGGTSKHRGVAWDRQRGQWRAYVKIQGKHIFLGRFNSEDAAAEAALMGRQRLMSGALD
jgi:hypothetical protein